MQLDHLLSMEKFLSASCKMKMFMSHLKTNYPEHVDKRIQGSDEVKEQVTKERTGNARGI